MIDVSAESEDSFLRNKVAGVCGVETGFAVPVKIKDKVSMIMAFFTCERAPILLNVWHYNGFGNKAFNFKILVKRIKVFGQKR